MLRNIILHQRVLMQDEAGLHLPLMDYNAHFTLKYPSKRVPQFTEYKEVILSSKFTYYRPSMNCVPVSSTRIQIQNLKYTELDTRLHFHSSSSVFNLHTLRVMYKFSTNSYYVVLCVCRHIC